MSTTAITNSLLMKLQPQAKQYEIRDSKVAGFMVRVYPSGNKTYLVEYDRAKKYTLGKVDIVDLKSARQKAKTILHEYSNGIDPMEQKRIDR